MGQRAQVDHLLPAAMFHSAGFVFMILAVFSQQKHAESFSDCIKRDFLVNKIKTNDFMQCVFESIAKTPVFLGKEKECIKLTVETLLPAVSILNRHERVNNDILTTTKLNFSLSVAEILAANYKADYQTVTSKISVLSKTLEKCCETTLECVNKEFISQLLEFLNNYAVDSVISTKISEYIAFKEHNFVSPYATSYQENSNTGSHYEVDIPSAEPSFSGYVTDLVNYVDDSLKRSDQFQHIFKSGISLQDIRRKAVLSIVKALPSFPVSSKVFCKIDRALQKAISNAADSARVASYSTAVAKIVLSELSSCGALTPSNGYEIASRFLKEFLQKSSSVNPQRDNLESRNQMDAETSDIASPSFKASVSFFSVPKSFSTSVSGYDFISFNKKKLRSARRKRESITITDEDIQECVNAVRDDEGDDYDVTASCNQIFSRGVWDEKADRTLDGDIKKLITLMYGGKRENIAKVLNFIDNYVPKFVRELIVSYDTIVNEISRNDDISLDINRQYVLKMKNAVDDVKKMNGVSYAEKYFYAKQIHKDMLEDMLIKLQVAEKRESVTITEEYMQNCINAVKRNLIVEKRITASCSKIFFRGMWDDKADRTLDGDIRKLISLIYDGKRDNLAKVLYFIDKYVPKYVRELIVSFVTVVNEFEKTGDFNLPINQPYLLQIRDAGIEIKNMNGDQPAEKYQNAKEIHKEMLENILTKLKVPKGESYSITNDYIQNCANSVKLILVNESNVLALCDKIFSRGVWDEKADKTLDGDIRKLITLAYDGKRENLAKVLYFIEKYVPKHVRELIVSYDTIINAFEKTEDFNLPINQPYFARIKEVVGGITNMSGDHPADNYQYAQQHHKDTLENMLDNLSAVTKKESISITAEDIQNCASSVKNSLEDESKVLASCSKIFNRGIWDAKANKTLDGDIRKLIPLIYEGQRENIARVLYFIVKYTPSTVQELIVSYDSIVSEFEKSQDFNIPKNQPYFGRIRDALIEVKRMDGDHSAEKYEAASQTHKDMLENILLKFRQFTRKESITITDEDIRNCAEAVKLNVEDESKVLVSCGHIFNRGVWDAKADRTLDGDIRKLMLLIYDGKRENIATVLRFIDKYEPRYVRERIVSYDTFINEFEKYEDFNRPENQPYFQQLYEAVTDIKKMDGSHPAEKYSTALQRHKDMTESILRKFNAIETNKLPTKENAVQNCIQAIREKTSNAKELCNQIFKTEENRKWSNSDEAWLESDLDNVIRHAYDGKRGNFVKVLAFVRKDLPYIEQTTKGYIILLEEMENKQPLSNSELKVFMKEVTESLQISDKPDDITTELGNILNDLKTRLKSLKDMVIQNCTEAIQEDITGDFTEAIEHCNQILKKENNRDWVSGQEYYKEDVKEIVRKAYGGDPQNLHKVLKFVAEKFPYSAQDILGYSTLLEELENNKHLSVENLNKLLEKVQSSKIVSISSEEFKTLRSRLEQLLKDKEEEAYKTFIKAIKAGYFTAEILDQWKQFYGGENDFKTDWVNYGYVHKLIQRTYDGKDYNFNYATKVTRTFYFAEQIVEGYQALLTEMERFQHLQEELLEYLEESISEIEDGALSDEYKIKFEKLKNRVKVLLDSKKVNEGEAMEECIEAVQNQNWTEAKLKCDKILLPRPTDNLFDGNVPEKEDLKHIVITIYSYNLVNMERALKLVQIFPHIHQRIKGYSILLFEIKKKNNDALYFSALNQLKEGIKTIMLSYDYTDIRPDHKKHFEAMKDSVTNSILEFVAKDQKYTAAKETLKYSNETMINIENVNVKIVTHYDLPPYFSEYPISVEIERMYKEAQSCIAEYKDFVLPDGWMPHSDEAKVDIWVFNDRDIFGSREGFARSYSSKDKEYLTVDGIYLYRKTENKARVRYFKHEFMHVLVFGGIEKSNFISSVPQWFHDGIAELAQHGPCNKMQLFLLRKKMKGNYFQSTWNTFDTFMKMICMDAKKQREQYAENRDLNYFLSYFGVLYLRMRHPEFLRKIMLDTRERGWEGLNDVPSSAKELSARKKLCGLFENETDVFLKWMENSAENISVCYSNQPATTFKLAYSPDSYPEDDSEYNFALSSDGKFSWKNLIDAFNKEDFELIDKQIERYRATLKSKIEKLNLIPLNDLMQQKEYINAILVFIEEIHTRREEITMNYYYYYADSFIRLVFEGIVLPTYQRASLEENAALLKREIQLAFNKFLLKAFSKDVPPDRKAFLSWYRTRCHEVNFCSADDFRKIMELLDKVDSTDDVEILGSETSHTNEMKYSHQQNNRECAKENGYYETVISKESYKNGSGRIYYLVTIFGIIGISLTAAFIFKNQLTSLLPRRNSQINKVHNQSANIGEVAVPLLTVPTVQAISKSSNEIQHGYL